MRSKETRLYQNEIQREAASKEFSELVSTHLTNFQDSLKDYAERLCGTSTPRALAAVEPLFFETKLEEIKQFLRVNGRLLDADQEQEEYERILNYLLVNERLQAAAIFLTDPVVRISARTRNDLEPLADYIVKGAVKMGNVAGAGEVARELCRSFLESPEYEEILIARVRESINEGSLQGLSALLDAVPLTNQAVLATRGEVQKAILDHISSRRLPECLPSIINSFSLESFVRGKDFSEALRRSCCASLDAGDLTYLPEIVSHLVVRKIVPLKSVLNEEVRRAAEIAIQRADSEIDYFKNFSTSPESGPESVRVRTQELENLCILLSPQAERKISSFVGTAMDLDDQQDEKPRPMRAEKIPSRKFRPSRPGPASDLPEFHE